jgi:aminoglycoside phosphotransferase (APT) family kinase protein
MHLDHPSAEQRPLRSREDQPIREHAIERYLKRAIHPNAQLLELKPLVEKSGSLKSYGYGEPLRVTFDVDGTIETLVIRTMKPDAFGHDRRSDRLQVLSLAFDTYRRIPKHVRAVDAGVFDPRGGLQSIPRGEPFLVTTYADGELYASILAREAELERAPAVSRDRTAALARYLAALHTQPASKEGYRRSLRDTVGSGEGIFGLTDSYSGAGVVDAERLEWIELAAVSWRWQLRNRAHRARRTHGDFHPFNLLFREHTDFTVLDTSRGSEGDPADDVTCLSINYLFFALTSNNGRFAGAMRDLWDVFWKIYLERSRDLEVLEVVAPFFAWRALVLASPCWYPSISDEVRDKILCFAERLLEGERFDPTDVEELLA